MILGIDPSSTRTGYALMDGPDKIVDAGYFTPNRTRDDAIVRIKAMAIDAKDFIQKHMPKVVVIEIPGGKARVRPGRGKSLPIWGMAAGGIAVLIDVWCPVELITVTEDQWTGGVSKARRQAMTRRQFPQYARVITSDQGADVSDAIQICQWQYEKMTRRVLDPIANRMLGTFVRAARPKR